jgi:hypothetical protein
MRRDLSVDRFEQHLANPMVEQSRKKSPPRHDASGSEYGPASGQDRVIGSDEVKGCRQGPALDERADPQIVLDISDSKKSQSRSRHARREPRCRGHADTAILVVDEAARTIHRRRHSVNPAG